MSFVKYRHNISNDKIFIMLFILINFIFVNCSSPQDQTISNLVSNLKSNEVGKIIYDTLDIGYINFNAGKIMNVDIILEKYKKIFNYKTKLNNMNLFKKSTDENVCKTELSDYKNKEFEIVSSISEYSREKDQIINSVRNVNKIKNVNSFIKEFYSRKKAAFIEIQKKFFLNKYLSIPIIEDLIRYSELLITFYKNKKKEILTTNNEFSLKRAMLSLVQDKNFVEINKNLNFIEKDFLEIFITNSGNLNDAQKDNFLNDLSNKCVLFNLEKHYNLLIKNNHFANTIIEKNHPNLRKINYCSKNIVILKYFSFKFFLPKYLKENIDKKFLITKFEKIVSILKWEKDYLQNTLENINQEYEVIIYKFSGKESYFDNEKQLFEEKEKNNEKEISLLDDKILLFNSNKISFYEVDLIKDLVKIKRDNCDYNYKTLEIYEKNTKKEFDYLENEFDLIKSIMDYDELQLEKLFNKDDEFNKLKDDKLQETSFISLQKLEQLIVTNKHVEEQNKENRLMDNTINLLQTTIKKINKDDIEDIDFDNI